MFQIKIQLINVVILMISDSMLLNSYILNP